MGTGSLVVVAESGTTQQRAYLDIPLWVELRSERFGEAFDRWTTDDGVGEH